VPAEEEARFVGAETSRRRSPSASNLAKVELRALDVQSVRKSLMYRRTLPRSRRDLRSDRTSDLASSTRSNPTGRPRPTPLFLLALFKSTGLFSPTVAVYKQVRLLDVKAVKGVKFAYRSTPETRELLSALRTWSTMPFESASPRM